MHSPRQFADDVAVIPSEDSHSSEYIASCDARREFISGFSGSAGCAVVTLDSAALATDGRYFHQAAKELDRDWTLLKQGLQGVPTWQEWAASHSSGGKFVAVDSSLLPGSAAKELGDQVRKAGGSGLIALEENLVDIVWSTDRPPRPCQPLKVLPEDLAGKSVTKKINELRKELSKKNCPGFFVSMLDEVAWLFNLRGNDIPYNPVFFSYATITPEEATLYIDESKLTGTCISHLQASKVRVRPYEKFFSDARQLFKEVMAKRRADRNGMGTGSFLISNRASWALTRALGGDGLVEEMRSPVGDAKAIKNEAEMKGMRSCHVRDGAALIEFFAWLENQLIEKEAIIDELQAAEKLEEIRSKHERFVGLSFTTISSSGPK